MGNILGLGYDKVFETWLSALDDPYQFLRPAFVPTHDEVAAGAEFYLKLLAVSLAMYVVIALFTGQGSLASKAKMFANGILGIALFLVTAAATHVPFWLLGGKSTFLGTCLTYIYAAGPYGPLMTFATCIMIAGMPAHLRRYAINPATAQRAGALAGQDPETDKITFFTGCFLVLGLMVWTLVVSFRCLGFSHDLSGWPFAIAIVLSLLISIPLGKISQSLVGALMGSPERDGAAPQTSSSGA
ncbi:MAG: hypothetical protein QOJ17_5374 [Rhodospirillaceae bacterium]|jgi:hypothetical protein|nr:hypothetical protein [Rhodospirillaceae bacterium]